MSAPPDAPENRVRFDKTINLGHLISMTTFLVALMVQWNMMDKRVLVLEVGSVAQVSRDAAQDATIKEKSQEVKEGLTDLKRSVEKLGDKMGASRESRQ